VADTIREFVASLGFSINESQQRNFVGALEGATLRAKLLGDAIESMAKTVASKVGEVAEHFEQLFYQSSRVGSSVAGIQAFEFAFKQLGSSVGDADAALESFGYKLRTQPGFEGWVSRMGVATRDTNGQLRETSKIIPELAQHIQKLHNPALSNVFREALGGISDQGWRTLNNPEFWQQYDKAISSEGAAGIDNDAAKKATEFEQQWREVWKRIGDMADGGYTKLLSALTDPMEKFNQWLGQHAPEIDQSIGKITKALSDVAVTWTDDLSALILGPDKMKGLDDTTNAITHFLDALKPLITELEDFNEKSKDWWFTKFMNWTAGGPGATGGMTPGGIYDPYSDPSNPAYSAGSENVPGIVGAAKSWWKRTMPRALGGGGAGAGVRGRAGESSLGTETAPIGAEGNSVLEAEKLVGASEVADQAKLKEYLRTGGVGMNPRDLAWCAGFVNATLGHAGIRGLVP
jgi:hypothetical protein